MNMIYDDLFNGYYLGRKVLVTGDTGFKGGWLSFWLQQLGAEVRGISLPEENRPWIFPNLNTAYSDIRDYPAVLDCVKNFRPDAVFHLAAMAILSDCQQNPRLAFETNTMGTVNVLSACADLRPSPRLVIVTSDKVYCPGPCRREDDPIGGDQEAYSASKSAAEMALLGYARTFPNLATARAGNVIGGGDFQTDRIVPDFVRAWTSGKSFRVRCPQAIRPWQHVLDCLSGYLRLMEKLPELSGDKSFNFGPLESRTVQELLDCLQAWKSVPVEYQSQSPIIETKVLSLSSDKARLRLQWRPLMSFKESMKFTTDWYEQHALGNDAHTLNISATQLESYIRNAHEQRACWTQNEHWLDDLTP